MTLTQAIMTEARRLGFTLVGVTTPEPPPHYQVFEDWLKAGRHAEMAYLESQRSRQSRADPRRILPDCRCILVLGISYPPSVSIPSLDVLPTPDGLDQQIHSPLRGQIASYAWQEDYHLWLPHRLKALAGFIEKQKGKPVSHVCYTDSGPILERDLAQRAGLGWIGKNTHLINPQYGSYKLLAEILLGIELEISQPFEVDRCGTCQRCQKACPTACILPDRTLDASRCISYLTIELRGIIPPALRPLMGNWIFGCDICQQVCPWNQRGSASETREIFSKTNMLYSDLIEILTLDAEAFAQRFRGSPIKRAKREGYLRNAAVALGNLLAQNPAHEQRNRATQVLRDAAKFDPSPLIRTHAAWALERSGEQKALQPSSRDEQDPMVKNESKW